MWLMRCCLILFCLTLTSITHAEETIDAITIEQAFKQWKSNYKQLEKKVKRNLSEDQANEVLQKMSAIQPEANQYRAYLEQSLEETQKRIQTLGEAPKEGEPAEDSSIKKQRNALNKQVTKLDADIKQLDLLLHNYRELQTQVISQQKQRLTTLLLTANPPIYQLDTWKLAWQQAQQASKELAKEWKAGIQDKHTNPQEWVALLISLGITMLVIFPLQRWLRKRFGYNASILIPSYLQRLRAALIRSLTSAIAVIFLVMVTWHEFIDKGLLENSFIANTLGALSAIIVSVTLIYSLINALLAPNYPHWRLETIHQEIANRLGKHLQRINIAFVLIVLLLIEYIPNDQWGQEALAIYHFALTVLYVWLLLPLLNASMWSVAGEQPINWSRPSYVFLRNLLKLSLFLLPILALVGFSQLAFFIVSSSLISAAALGATWFLRRIGHMLIFKLTEPKLEATETQSIISTWLQFAVDLVLLIGVVLLILMIWGVPNGEVRLLINDVLFGKISIGNIQFSLIYILRGIFIFTLALWVTRRIKSLFANYIFPRSHLDKATSSSLVSIIGYLGFLISTLLALSALKIDLSNIAIIFGALSVGIGFGLQHIVNNFMSGLILLFQRPFKEGDWIVVGQHEGYVKNISVIATELETFDNAAVLIPNSQMTTTAVQNWTLHSKLGRVIVPILTPLTADPNEVKDILADCLSEGEDILPRPEPYVVLMDITSQGMNFQMRFYIKDIEYCVRMGSDMRLAALAKLKQRGIEVPLNQQIIHIESQHAT